MSSAQTNPGSSSVQAPSTTSGQPHIYQSAIQEAWHNAYNTMLARKRGGDRPGMRANIHALGSFTLFENSTRGWEKHRSDQPVQTHWSARHAGSAGFPSDHAWRTYRNKTMRELRADERIGALVTA